MSETVPPSSPMLSGKIGPSHRDRLAIVYIRQSSLQQVERNQESTRLQYALVDRAVALGWARERVVPIDDDLGCSGASAEGRPGFQRLVAEVSLGNVGLVLGIDMSRLARSCRDWHQLLEICARSDTLIADVDGVYDPSSYNDRLLLGLKGTLSEAELHVLKARLQEGRHAKARRGDLHAALPRGYIRRPSGEVVKDPDEQVQAMIGFVFDLFERHHSMRGVLRYLSAHELRLPDRERSGPTKGNLVWRRPNWSAVRDILHNPAYAGAYVHGRCRIDRRRHQPGRRASGRRYYPLEQWTVLIKDRLPAYITWEQYERNLVHLTSNRPHHLGTPRGGAALLAGVLACGRCGHRMASVYHNNGRRLRYICYHDAVRFALPLCQSLIGEGLDEHVGVLVLEALQPAALDVSLRLAEDLELERAGLHQQWAHRLERARFAVSDAERRYKAVDADNRLVARTLERQWEEALAAQIQLHEEHARFLAREPARLSEAERSAIRHLAEDIPALWRAETTTAQERQAIVRLVLERVEVLIVNNSEQVEVTCHWAGGHQTRTTMMRPVLRLEQLSFAEDLLARVRQLSAEGQTASAIAETLNAEGWVTPKRRAAFNRDIVSHLLRRLGIRRHFRARYSDAIKGRSADEYTVSELAAKLDIPAGTLNNWLVQGKLTARCVEVKNRRVRLISADDTECQRLRELRDRNLEKQHRLIPLDPPQNAH